MKGFTESSVGEGQRRVLVVEDDSAVARMLRLALGRTGFDVVLADTGGEALRRLGSDDIDAVVLDLGLPDDRAGDVLEHLRDPGAPHHPVWVVITAQDRDDVTRRFGDLGSHFVSKPFDPWHLVERLLPNSS